MLYFFKNLLFLINIDQETVLNWFGVENPTNLNILNDNVNLSNNEVKSVSFETFKLIVQGLWQQVEDGLTLSDIESLLFFILFIRFVILAIRYNLKTSFYITCIGLFAGYLWYRHLIDVITMYRTMLIKTPYLSKLGVDAIQLSEGSRVSMMRDLKLGDNVHWYNPGQLIYYAFIKGIIKTDPEMGLRYYIDPISMYISNLNDSDKAFILPYYYKIYNSFIPRAFEAVSKFWAQLSGIAAYALVTRIGKRYCPYLVRWHWTFLLIIGFVEQIFVYFVYRVWWFQESILIPQLMSSEGPESLPGQIAVLNLISTIIISTHIGLTAFALFHAIWGQYFYFPFITENTELHIGPRPKNSIYSGGNTAWQDEKEQNIERIYPKLWFGLFGRGTKNTTNIFKSIKNLITITVKKIRKQFRK